MSSSEQASMTRRQLLATVAKVGVSAPLMAAAGVAEVQAPRPPSNLRVLDVSPVPASAQRVLTLADLSFAGYIRFPADFNDLWYAYGQLTLRRVGGQLRAFTAGNITNDYPVLEYGVPDRPALTLSSAPLMTPIRNWGTIPNSVRITGGTGGSILGGFWWDEARKGIWVPYKDAYAPVEHHPSELFISLPDNGTMKIYGPWRTAWNSQRTSGGHTPIPQSFVDAYLGGGSNLGVTAYSHNADSPFGAILSRLVLPDPFTTPPDVSLSKHTTIPNDGLILHDIQHRMKRDQRYKFCNWTERYDCAKGSTVEVGPPLFGGPEYALGSSDQDTMSSALWIDLPEKHGLLYFGQLGTTPEGYTAPGDKDGLTHLWYGAAGSTANPVGQPRYCCHGQFDPYWDATGPGCHYRVAKGWIYNPNDLAATAQKKADLWSRIPTSEFEWGKILPQANGPVRPGFWGGSAFDAASRRIYVVLSAADTILPGKGRPVIAVFEIG